MSTADATHPRELLQRALGSTYTIERELGRGGMATVYLAHDRRHGRPVAVKVLHAELAAILGADRFLAEIHTTASLQHPHILPLFDSGQAEGRLFYVMPFVEGETLRARIEREGPLPVADAVRIAEEVADALDYAHRRGVIHRDVKPENVLLAGTPGDSTAGHALVADFGIALAVQEAGGQRLTQTGLSLGTPQYMAPEQAAGERNVGARADVYALGVVTYEMLAGEPPFTAPTTQGVLARLMTEAPRRLSTIRRSVPATVDAAVDRALEKLPADRFASSREFAEALHAPPAPPARSGSADTRTRSETTERRRPALGTIVPWSAFLVAATLAAWSWHRVAATDNAPVTRFNLTTPEDPKPAPDPYASMALSPDGRIVAFVGGGERQVFVRRLDELQTKAVPGVVHANNLAFSPDGKVLAFIADERLKIVRLLDSRVTPLVANVNDFPGVAWRGDDIVFTMPEPNRPGLAALWTVSSDGGQPRRLCRLNEAAGERVQTWPYPLPRQDVVLYTSADDDFREVRLAACDTKTGTTHFLGHTEAEVIGSIDNRVVFVQRDGTLMGQAFDEDPVRLRGDPVKLADGVSMGLTKAPAAISSTGMLVYMSSSRSSRLVLVRKEGIPHPLTDEPQVFLTPRLTPDGQRIAFTIADPSGEDVWLYDTPSRTLTRLTNTRDSNRPEWTRDGKRVLFVSARDGNKWAIWSQAADGSAPPEKLFASANQIHEVVPTPDGRAIVFREDHLTRRRDIYLLSLTGERSPLPLLVTPADELMPRISPDGRWLAYQSDESGRVEVYVRAFPGGGGRVQVSADGGSEPMWAPDGKRLYYRNNGQVMAAAIIAANGAAPNVTSREVVTEGDFLVSPFHQNYDVTPDGRDLLMLMPSASAGRLVVVLNWQRELRARVP